MLRDFALIRNLEAPHYFEVFLVSAASSILLLRFYLYLTSYPQIGTGGIHIAHMLWGGLLMFASITLLFTYLNRTISYLAVTVGGLGFGIFIDELGKFVTRDNNYFFQPAIALIYVILISSYLLFNYFYNRQTIRSEEYLVNSLEAIREAIISDLQAEEKKQVVDYISKADPSNKLTILIKELIGRLETLPSTPPNRLIRLRNLIYEKSEQVINSPYYRQLLIALLLLQLVIFPLSAIYYLDLTSGNPFDNFTFTRYGELFFSVISGILILAGLLILGRSSLKAYKVFKFSVLINIFFTQLFTFYNEQTSAVFALFFHLFVLIILNYLINREELNLLQA